MTATVIELRSVEVCRAAGITYRQLDHWRRLGIIRPSIAESRGTGSWDIWSPEDLRVITILGRVANLTHSVQLAARAVPVLREQASRLDDWRWLVITPTGADLVRDDDVLAIVLRGCTSIVVSIETDT